MTDSNSKTRSNFSDNFNSRTSRWLLLLALFCGALLLPGCGGGAGPSKLDRELKALESETASERETALLHLADMGKAEAESAASKAVGFLKDENAGVRGAAVKLLVKFEHKTPDALTALGSLAQSDSDESVQGEALQALQELGATDKYIEVCIAFLTGADAGKQSIGANGLQGVEKGAAVAAQAALLTRLKDGSAEVRSQCVYALGNLGAKASDETKAALEAAAKDPDKDVAEAGKAALESLNE